MPEDSGNLIDSSEKTHHLEYREAALQISLQSSPLFNEDAYPYIILLYSAMDDRYQIIQKTSELPFGIQFEATDLLISRKAQIHRFTTPKENAPSNWKELYDKGSGTLTALSHMGLPIIYDRGVNDAGPYLIRQLVNEPTLASRLELGPLSEYEVWELAQQLLEIHSIAKDREFFHGALLLDQISYAKRPGGEKRYYVIDFGLAELHNLIHGTHKYFGHPCLVSLEQVAGESPTEVSQIFSIGQLLYLCLADNHPFASNRADEMKELHKNYPIAPVSSFRSDIPQPMVEWISRLTDADPEKRFSTYNEALETLPAPVNTALIPTIPTTTTQQQVQMSATQATSVQEAMAQTGTQPVAYTAPVTQAVTATTSNNALKQLLQEPLILGGIVAVIALIIGGFFFLSDDSEEQDGKAKSSASDPVAKKSTKPISEEERIKQGLAVAFNFNENLTSETESHLKLEHLKSSPSYQKGLYGKGLVLSKNHFYRLSLKGLLNDDPPSDFTISFWVKNIAQKSPALISNQPWSRGNSQKLTNQGKELWQWIPENSFTSDKDTEAGQEAWNMITLVFSLKKEEVSVYNNGQRIGSSSTESIKTLDAEKYLYLGCDSNQKFNFTSPAVIDQLYIWARKLSSKEIREMHKDRTTF